MVDVADDVPKPHGLSGIIARLRDNARAFVRAEVEYVIADLGIRASAIMPAVAMIMIAMALCFSAVTAILVGFIIGLAPYLTIWGAIGVVIVTTLLVAFILVRQAMAVIRVARTPEEETHETVA